jgi:membrane-associated phospholipid phosphatase
MYAMPLKIDKWIEEKFSDKTIHKTDLDDLLKWTPFTAIFILDLLGIRSRHKWKKHLLLLGVCETILTVVSNSLKKTVHEHRPEPTSRYDSFPSGHAATAFAGAEIIRQELKENYPVLSYAGYATALSVSALRLYKDKHWMTDLLGGAMLGIFCTKLTYWIIGKRKRKSAIAEQDQGNGVHVDTEGQLQMNFK